MSDAAQLKHTVADLRKENDQLHRERMEHARVIAELQNELFQLKARLRILEPLSEPIWDARNSEEPT